MDYLKFCVFSFLAWKSINGAISIKGYGSLKINSQLLLACQITSFNSGATWSNSNMPPINCDKGGFCDTFSKDNFRFSGNTSGIFVMIDPLLKKYDNMTWTCFYNSTNTSYTVKIDSSQSSSQTPSGLTKGAIAGIVVAVCLVVIGALIIGAVFYCKRR
ncbi:unnamed protein product [Mytilus coruscus]|uniref:Uncharacterized protein n=1 Tax=Mytilus coruscus TaxID=42192 RepID=A0A6J8BYA9_MYTCO|nr:unnamed protein product [Mytilus coruscus]